MTIQKKQEGSSVVFEIEGRIDTTTSVQLEAEVKTLTHDIKELCFDFANVSYISSAGLRVLLAAQKFMNQQGKMYLTNVKDDIKEIFEITGFSDILTIK